VNRRRHHQRRSDQHKKQAQEAAHKIWLAAHGQNVTATLV
jgi:hypothetical protein